MMKFTTAASLGLLVAHGASAGGLDRSGQPIGIIFERGNYAELSFGSVTPSLTGTDFLTNPISNVGGSFVQLGGGIKYDFSDKFSFALIADQPYGSDVTYPGSPLTTMLGGTEAIADSFSLTAIGRYKITDRFSVHGGVRYQTIEGDITLSGLAYGGLNGYNVALSRDDAFGYVVGGAFEIPEYAMRVALTYNSEITHSMATVETIGGGPLPPSINTELKSPASFNLDFQTGLNPKTLLFGSVRYAKWSDLIISPVHFDDLATDGALNGVGSGVSISDLEDTWSYTLGVGRKLTDNFSASVVLGYEPTGTDDLVSPLSPTNGNWSIGLGGKYTKGNMSITGGVKYIMVGDARPETGTPDTARASFTDNHAVAFGMKVGWSF